MPRARARARATGQRPASGCVVSEAVGIARRSVAAFVVAAALSTGAVPPTPAREGRAAAPPTLSAFAGGVPVALDAETQDRLALATHRLFESCRPFSAVVVGQSPPQQELTRQWDEQRLRPHVVLEFAGPGSVSRHEPSARRLTVPVGLEHESGPAPVLARAHGGPSHGLHQVLRTRWPAPHVRLPLGHPGDDCVRQVRPVAPPPPPVTGRRRDPDRAARALRPRRVRR